MMAGTMQANKTGAMMGALDQKVSLLGSWRASARVLAMVMLATATLWFSGCDEPVDYSTAPPPASSLRIVSLSPALTQILIDLGQGEYIVGVGENDDAAPAGTKVVGTYLNINAEQIVSLNPTLVLTMSGRDGPPARLKELADKHFMLVDYPYPQTPTDVGNIIFRESEMHSSLATTSMPDQMQAQVDAQTQEKLDPEAAQAAVYTGPPSIGSLLDLILPSMSLKYTMLRRLGEISKLTTADGQDSPSVLMVIGTGPVMASGPGTVLDQMLVLAGGSNAASQTNTTAPTFDREKLVSLKPDVVLYFDPKGQPLAALGQEPRLADFLGLDIPAVKQNRIVIIDHPLAMLPTSTLDKTAGMMAKAIHPELSEKIDKILASSMVELERQADIDSVSQKADALPDIKPGSVSNQPAGSSAIPEAAQTEATQPQVKQPEVTPEAAPEATPSAAPADAK